MRPRSYLYVPGDSERKLASARRSSADAVILDLEDAVAAGCKAGAWRLVRRWLEDADATADKEIWIRLALRDDLEDDIHALTGAPAVHGLVLAKTESVDDVARVGRHLREHADDRIALMPLLESANAILRSEDIARASRVDSLQIGEADLRADLGVTVDEDESELLFARSSVVFSSVAAAIAPPVGPVSTNFTDMTGFRTSCERLRRLGFVGRACIHPRQVEVVHQASVPSASEIDAARSVVAAFDSSLARGDAVTTGVDGRLVDLAVVKRARSLLADFDAPTV